MKIGAGTVATVALLLVGAWFVAELRAGGDPFGVIFGDVQMQLDVPFIPWF